MKLKDFDIEVIISPLPKNCCKCPFYYCPNPEDLYTWDEIYICYLDGIKDIRGIALHRSLDCPLKEKGE